MHQVERRLLLDVIVRKSSAILKLLACEDEALLVWRNAFFILDLRFHIVNRVGGLHIKSDGLAREGLDKDLHASAEAKHQVERRLLLDVIVRESPAIFKLLARENEALLVWRNAFFILNLRFHIVDRVGGLHIKSDGLAREGLDKDLHASAEAKHQVERRLLLDVIVRKS